MGKRGNYVYYDAPPTHKVRNFFLYLFALIIVTVLMVLAFNFAQNGQCSLERKNVTVHNLPKDLENWTILHLSDLNGKEIGSSQGAVKKAVGGKAFSCVVMTGDMVGEDGNVEPLLDLLAVLPENVPKMLIPGDCDPPLVNTTSSDSLDVYASWARKAEEAGVIILDRPVSFTREKSTIWFIPEEIYSLNIDGMLNAYISQEKELTGKITLTPEESALLRACRYQIVRLRDIKEISGKIKSDDIQVCVTHTPLTEEYVSTMYSWKNKDSALSFHNVALILAGHYAGGQWRLPVLGAIYVPDLGFFPEDSLVEGMHYVGGIPQYISSGLGDSSFYPFPGRLFNKPTAGQIVLTSSYK